MTWVVMGHIFLLTENYVNAINRGYLVTDVRSQVPTISKDSFAQNIFRFQFKTSFLFRVIMNAFPSVDSFFIMSGCLLSYLTLKEMDKTKGWLNVPMFYIHRYIRWNGRYTFLQVMYYMQVALSFYCFG